MISPRSLLFLQLVLPIFFTLLSHGASQILPPKSRQSSGLITGWAGGVHRKTGRSVVETASSGDNSSFILADKRTRRKDPSNDFKYYAGGWNISDHHYISSVSFTAAPLFAIAVTWFMGFGLSLLLICCCYCCIRRRPYGYSKTTYALSLVFLCLFTICAIVGCVVLYTGQGRFNDSTTDTLDYVVSQSNDTVYNLNNVSTILDVANGIEVGQVSLPSDIKNNIHRVHKMISDASRSLQFETRKNENDIKRVLKVV